MRPKPSYSNGRISTLWYTLSIYRLFKVPSISGLCLTRDYEKQGTHNLQAGGRGFESLNIHQTANELEKPSQKCGGFSVSYSEVTVIAPNK
jgi:hypothetical protein